MRLNTSSLKRLFPIVCSLKLSLFVELSFFLVPRNVFRAFYFLHWIGCFKS